MCRWYPLKCKPGQKKDDYRGELEVKTSFTVKAVDEDKQKRSSKGKEVAGSVSDLAGSKKDKNKGSLQSLNKKAGALGGSLMSLGSKVICLSRVFQIRAKISSRFMVTT